MQEVAILAERADVTEEIVRLNSHYNQLDKLLNSGKTNTDYYKAINTYLGIKKENLNIYLRQQLDIEANI